jgi:hypothetical protein
MACSPKCVSRWIELVNFHGLLALKASDAAVKKTRDLQCCQ